MIQPVVVDSQVAELRASHNEGLRTSLGRDAQELAARPAEFFRDAPPTPAPTPAAKKKSWLPWSRPGSP